LRIFSLAGPVEFNTLLTVATPHPARCATSLIVAAWPNSHLPMETFPFIVTEKLITAQEIFSAKNLLF
jgi:hypothetical protein